MIVVFSRFSLIQGAMASVQDSGSTVWTEIVNLYGWRYKYGRRYKGVTIHDVKPNWS